MSERYSKSIKVLVGEFAKNVDLDVILSEALSVLPETELLKPLCNLLHCGPLEGSIRNAIIPRSPIITECARTAQRRFASIFATS